MNEEEKPVPVMEALADGFGCLMMIVLMFGVMGGLFFLRLEQAKEMVKTYQKDLTTEAGHVIGRVKTVETWKAEKFVHKDGDATFTLDITDRTKVIFEDGRTKELLGMPKEPIPTDKDVVVVWAKFDLLLEVVPAEEYKKR